MPAPHPTPRPGRRFWRRIPPSVIRGGLVALILTAAIALLGGFALHLAISLSSIPASTP